MLGIGNRWANRHTGSPEVYCKGRRFIHVDIEPTQIGRVFAPDYGIVSDAKAALQLFVEVAREWKAAGSLRDWSGWARECQGRKGSIEYLRKTNFDSVPMKPQRVYQCMNNAFGKDVDLRLDDRPEPDRRRAVPARLPPAPLDQLRPGRPARLDDPGRARRSGGRPEPQDRGAFGRLRLPVHDRRAGRGRAVQAALHPHRRQQQLPRPHPPEPARLHDGLLRSARLREHQLRRRRRDRAGLRRRPRQGGRGPGLQGHPRAPAGRDRAGHQARRGLDGGVHRCRW